VVALSEQGKEHSGEPLKSQLQEHKGGKGMAFGDKLPQVNFQAALATSCALMSEFLHLSES
jgi:hypothetical protein